MAFHDSAIFPAGLSYGYSGGPGWKNVIQQLDSGAEKRVARWSGGRGRYDVGMQVKKQEAITEVLEFIRCRQGSTHGFRFFDWFDYSTGESGIYRHAQPTGVYFSAWDDELLGVGDGATKDFQAKKTYTSGGVTVTRNIEKIITGTMKVGWSGSSQGSGWSVDESTGLISFTTAPVLGLNLYHGFEFHVPVRFGTDFDEGLQAIIEAYNSVSAPAIPIIEIAGEAQSVDDYSYGGARSDTITASVTLSAANGRVRRFICNASGLEVRLATAATGLNSTPFGGFHHIIINDSTSTHGFNVMDESSSTLVTLTAGNAVATWLGKDSGGNRVWNAY